MGSHWLSRNLGEIKDMLMFNVAKGIFIRSSTKPYNIWILYWKYTRYFSRYSSNCMEYPMNMGISHSPFENIPLSHVVQIFIRSELWNPNLTPGHGKNLHLWTLRLSILAPLQACTSSLLWHTPWPHGVDTNFIITHVMYEVKESWI